MRVLSHFKKLMVLTIAAISISIVGMSNLRAQDSGGSLADIYLYYIMQYTYGTMEALNNLPNYLDGLGQFVYSWLEEDNSDTTRQMQGNFATLGGRILQNAGAQNSADSEHGGLLNRVAVDMLAGDPDAMADANVNDIIYASLNNQPVFSINENDRDPAWNYLKNASGLNIQHKFPGPTFKPNNQDDLTKYKSYYRTVMAVESFNAYVLSNQYADKFADGEHHTRLSDFQYSLLGQASNSDWIANIATEELGKVLRQILMFESQSYVLMTQLVQAQQQQLTAQVMTNTLLIQNNLSNENYMMSKAKGVRPTG